MKNNIFLRAVLFFFIGTNLYFTQSVAKKDSVSTVPKDSINSVERVQLTKGKKEIKRSTDIIPVDTYSAKFFERNYSNSIFEALQNINGIRPQINCSLCNTGDIHMNGLEGPYTTVLIDDMPIVTSLGTVYGLSGIPNSLIDQIEITRGPASLLYGAETVAGTINIITKHPKNAPLISTESFLTNWGEFNLDFGLKTKINSKVQLLTGLNYFNFQRRIDKNDDNFTDSSLAHRISLFNKWNFKRPNNKILSIATRYFYEDRWGGETTWKKQHRGGNQIYGESIYTNRAEIFGLYQLPTELPLKLMFSYVYHNQDSRYGTTPFLAEQQTLFGQLYWEKKNKNHHWLAGLSTKYLYYDDSTPATKSSDLTNQPNKVLSPGFFLQNKYTFSNRLQGLAGLRYDYHPNHHSILTPRVGFKWNFTEDNYLRFNAGTGFRTVNIFTEDHAALSGSRDVIIAENIKPETSYNFNLNYTHHLYFNNGTTILAEAAYFYSYFNNRILPNYTTNTQQILYNNINGYGTNHGLSLNIDLSLPIGTKFNLGVNWLDNTIVDNGKKLRPLFTEKLSGTWSISHTIRPMNLSIDYTGNFYSPMLLPLQNSLDPRPSSSPWFSIQNIQIRMTPLKNCELFLSLKNIFNWTPSKNLPFLIANANDPFNNNVEYHTDGSPLSTATNPYGLEFDPTYIYTANQGRRFQIGFKYHIK